jgi:hypothetical protein
MNSIRLLLSLVACSVLVTSLLLGPLVGAVDLRSEVSDQIPGDGSADIDILSLPEEGQLKPKPYLTGGYVVSLPSGVVKVSKRSGYPLLVYKLRIPSVWYVAVTTYVLDESSTGRQTMTLDEPVLNRTSLSRDSYGGQLLVIGRSNGHDTIVSRRNVTLWVDQ